MLSVVDLFYEFYFTVGIALVKTTSIDFLGDHQNGYLFTGSIFLGNRN